jgi:protein-disulfide isomerase
MRSMRSIAALLLAAGWANCPLLAGDACSPIKDSDKAKLLTYVEKRYKLPPATHLDVAVATFVGSTCYRKLQFVLRDTRKPFPLELYASPDLRFLARELLDSSIDPIEEERQKERALMAGLANGDFPALGPRTAPVTITVFSDFQCPYCARMAGVLRNEVLPAEPENVRLVFRNLPLPMHPWARPAAEAAGCAREQGGSYFWSMHDYLFEHQGEITPDNLQQKLLGYTKQLHNFDQSRFKACLAAKRIAGEIDADMSFATQNAINATPTLFFNGKRARVSGAEQIRTIVRELVAAARKQS